MSSHIGKSAEKVAIRPSACLTSIKKSDSVGYVPYEPVKGAVKGAVVRQPQHLMTTHGSHLSSTAGHHTSAGGHHWDIKSAVSGSVTPGHAELCRLPPRDDRLPADGSDSSTIVVVQEPHLSNSWPPGDTINSVHLIPSIGKGATALEIGSSMVAAYGSDAAIASPTDGWFDQAIALVRPTLPSGKVVENSEVVQRLKGEVLTLKEQLVVQSKVNADLKKLLVASIGDDLHHKVDALVRTKIQLANEIDDYTKKLLEDYEDLDKISIQADIWHSKYKASRVLVEQLTSERDRVSAVLNNLRTALSCLVNEQHDAHQLLALTNRNLESLVANTLASGPEAVDVKCQQHCIQLAMSNKRLSDELCLSAFKALPAHCLSSSAHCLLSPAESLAVKVLNESTVVNETESLCDTATHQMSLLQPRFQPLTRFSGVTYNCCARCIGEVQLL